MSKLLPVILLLGLSLSVQAAPTPLDLMQEGRFGEARALLDAQTWPPCYHLMYLGMTDTNVAQACSLYQVVAIRYPLSDCDRVARARLWDAKNAGVNVTPIAEWSRALPDVAPLWAAAPPPSITPSDSELPQPVENMDWKYLAEEAKKADTLSTMTPLQPAPVNPTGDARVLRKLDAPDRTDVLPREGSEPDVEATPGNWFVQVGAFGNVDNAHRLADQLMKAGFGVKLVPGGSSAKPLMQVRVGGYATREELNPVIGTLKDDYGLPTAVVKE